MGETKPLLKSPGVSVVTVVFNGAKDLEETIVSVVNQTYQDMEYIIIDGGSADGSVEIIEKYAHRISAWISEPDHGIYDAMNKGIQRALGEWIIFMNCGDRFASGEVLEFFRNEAPDADIMYGEAIIEYPTFETRYPRIAIERMWKRMPFCHQAAFVRTSLLKAEQFDLTYRFSADFDFFYKAYLSHKKFLFVDRLICRFDFKQGASKDYGLVSTKERMHSVLKQGFSIHKSLYYFFQIVYVRLSMLIKGMVGEKLTAWVTRLLRT